MVDMNKPWVVDSRLSERFPVYTRGNAGEVAGMVASCEGMKLPSTQASSAVVVGAATSSDMGAYLGRP